MLCDFLWERLRDRAHGREAKPITLADSKPQPDMAIARGRRQDDRGRHPTAEEMLLLVEVAPATHRHDLIPKRDLYARAQIPQIPEYWVVDVAGAQVVVFRHPDQGHYTESLTVATGTITPQAFPASAIEVAQLFGWVWEES